MDLGDRPQGCDFTEGTRDMGQLPPMCAIQDNCFARKRAQEMQ